MVDHSAHAMPRPGAGNERALRISAWLTGIYFFIELGIGLYSGSVAVITEMGMRALHPLVRPWRSLSMSRE